ncbi:MAG: integral rane sensor signal transduction histidine kinase [Myxococcales bacterium]|nr:integral rane sensor signal transduction histidine kinase [Myxococcales bacterium]
MKVATRITVATAVVVALASAAYAYFDLRARETERRTTLDREARAVTSTLRSNLEVPPFRAPSEAQQRDLSKASGWKVTVIAAARATLPPSSDVSDVQLRRLRTMIDVPIARSDFDTDGFFYAVPLRAPQAPSSEEREILGMLEISRPADIIHVTGDDLARAAALVLLIVVVTTIVVGVLASRFVSRPIKKLLRGIDDVAKGDLSHVILSERDDEIGQIATRFNDMTFSLRESRGETQRQNEAKLALEQRLGQTEKLATIGQLAAEIAHEVGTPLNVIAGRARSIQKKSRDPDAVEKNAEIVAEQTARITRIIQRLLDFTRRKVGSAATGQVSLNDLLQTTIELLAGQFSSAKVKTRLDRADALPKVNGDADRLQQVLINLLLNAVQAMPEGGTLTVETRLVKRTRPGLESNAEQNFIRFSIRDTGIGIPAEIKDKIFDPFYTTKEGQGGTGLGLAVVSGIVKEHDGWIDVEDSDGGGTVFRVYLPA